jgi:FkbM family methyltransferase
MGRKAFVRLTRFLHNEARLDTPNLAMRHNGELLVQRVVVQNAPRDRPLVVFDVGAHEGEWTKYLLAECDAQGRQTVHLSCFEPVARSRSILASSVQSGQRGTNVTIVSAAVSDTIGTADLHVAPPGKGLSSFHEQIARPAMPVESVETVTLDAFCANKAIEHVDLVKIDVEGHELAVIRGAAALLEPQALGVVQFEYNHHWIQARSFLLDAFALLQPLGYHLGKVTPRGIEFYPRWHHDLDTFSQGNYLACTGAWSRRFPAIRWYRDM